MVALYDVEKRLLTSGRGGRGQRQPVSMYPRLARRDAHPSSCTLTLIHQRRLANTRVSQDLRSERMDGWVGVSGYV